MAAPKPGIPDIDRLPAGAFLTRRQVAALSSFAEITLRVWEAQHRGPQVTRIEGRPRYRVSDVREWLRPHAEGVFA